MKKMILNFCGLIFSVGLVYSQKEDHYYFINERYYFNSVDLIAGVERKLDNDCVIYLKFTDSSKTIIKKEVRCDSILQTSCFYLVPKKRKRIVYQTNGSFPPYDIVTKREKAFYIEDNCDDKKLIE
jgi:hypothetical protein